MSAVNAPDVKKRTYCPGCAVDRGVLKYDLCNACGTDLVLPPVKNKPKPKCPACSSTLHQPLGNEQYACRECGSLYEMK